MSNKSFQKDIPQLEGSNDDSHAKRKAFVGWNIRDENGREQSGKPLNCYYSCFSCREREREWKMRTGKRIRYYGISGTEHIDREHVDYDRENFNYREHNTCNYFKQLARRNSYSYVYITHHQGNREAVQAAL